MADSKGPVNRSLLWMLSASICGTILLVGIIAALSSFWFSFGEARDLQDDELREIARLVKLGDEQLLSPASPPWQDDEPEMRIWVIKVSKAPTNITTPELSLSLPGSLPDGYHSIESKGESWRIYVRHLNAEYGLAVAQRTSARDEIARDSALRTLLPLLVIIPILIFLTALLIRVLLRKLHEVSMEVDKKGEADLTPVDTTGLPAELLPFVGSTNKLLVRIETSLRQQGQLVADAAHELRSPVTAMTLQLENAMAAHLPPETVASRLAPLGASLVRMRKLVEQLLALAKLNSSAAADNSLIDARAIVIESIEEFFSLANARNIDLGVEVGDSVTVRGNEHDFRAIVRNAVENAIVYTPAGGKVDVRCSHREGEIIFEVEDSGPGISEQELTRVFDPFYRVPGNTQPGSGLGLAITQSAASRLGGNVELKSASAGSSAGLRFIYSQKVTLR
ncbi:ATP-binding protein [Duganella hordei]|uniref:ATP-binding protein n=1 Tax=Duganella hordei TaxID=2865934 RepID=UPI0030EA3A55